MSTQITTAFVKQFSANVDFLVQQKGSKLRDAVRVETGVRGEEAYFDAVGAVAAVKRTSRHADTPLIETPHSKRKVILYDYEWADLIDDPDKIKTLIDPENAYAQNAAWAMGRAIDDAIIEAATGTAYSGKDGSTSVSLPSGQIVSSNSEGLTLAKLLEAKYILDSNDVDPDEPRYCALTAYQLKELLNTTEVKSADYNTIRALVAGQVDTFLGFKFIITNRLGTNASGERKVLCWAKNGLLLAIGQDIKSRISERADKSYATQVYYAMSIGATRMEEKKVVEIDCVES